MRNPTIRHITLICFIGIGIGIAGFILFPKIPVLSDSIGYFTVARNLLLAKGLVSSYVGPNEAFIMGLPCPDIHMPGWPLLVAGFMFITRTGLYAPLILNILLTVSSALIFYFTVRLWSDTRRALVSSLFFLLFPLILGYEFTALSEISLVFWSLLAVFLASASNPKRAVLWLAAIGLVYSLAFCTRQTSILLVPLISLILAENGFSRIHAVCFGLTLVLVSALANLAYSSVDSLREAQSLLFRYDLLLHTGFLKVSFNRAILTPQDLSPDVPLTHLIWAVLLKKPVRMLASYIAPESIWHLENLMKLLVVVVLAGGPFFVPRKRIRWGLLAFASLFLMALWLYRFEARQFIALSAVTICFVFALARDLRMRPWLIRVIFSAWVILGVFYTLELQRERIAVYRAERDVAPVVAGLLPPCSKVSVGYPSTIALYRSDISVVTIPEGTDDLALLSEKPGLDAMILSAPEPEIVSWGWSEETLILNSDTLFVYRRIR
ncbi:MAG: glycosyltransferase family 39 protein [Candidatus Hydrothermia bacterium]